MKKFIAISAGLILGAAVASAAAEARTPADDFFQFMSEEANVVMVASGNRPERVIDSVSNVSIIDRATIEKHNFANVSEALQILPGVMVWRTYIMQHVPTLRGGLQDHYANKVLVLIDGVPAFNAVTAEGDLDRVGIDAVERIEVLRGPASVIYGSNALNGAINIVLKKAPKEGRVGQARAGVGTGYGKFHGTLEVERAGGLYAWRNTAGSSYLIAADMSNEAAPLYPFSDESKQVSWVKDYFKARSFNFRGQSGGHSLLINVAASNQTGFGNSISKASGLGFDHEKEMELVNYSHTWGAEERSLTYSATYDRQRRAIPRNADDSLRSEILGYRLVNRLGFHMDLPRNMTLELGGDHGYTAASRYSNINPNDQSTIDENSMRNRSVWDGSLFAQLGFNPASWKLLLGSRYTNNKAFGSNFSSRGTAIYMLNDSSSLKLVLGQAYRAPSIFELYFRPTPVTVLGTPTLSPEKSRSVETSYAYSRGRFFGQVTGYYAEYLSTIYRNVGDVTRDGVVYSNVNFYSNAGKITAKGIESELRYADALTQGFLSFNYIYGSKGDAHVITPTAGEAIKIYNFKFVPRYTLAAGVSRTIGNFFTSANLIHYSSLESLRTRIPPDYWLNTTVGYQQGPFRHAFSVKNMTDRSISIPEHVRQKVVESMPLVNGRSMDYTISYRF